MPSKEASVVQAAWENFAQYFKQAAGTCSKVEQS
jgi:hypothetical protein